MNNIYYIFVVLGISLLFINEQKTMGFSDNDFLNYTDYNNKFTLKYPSNWSLTDTEYSCQESPSLNNVLMLTPYANPNKHQLEKLLIFIDKPNNTNNYTISEYAVKQLNFYKNFGDIIKFRTDPKDNNEGSYQVIIKQNQESITDENKNNSLTIGEIGTLIDSQVYRFIYIAEEEQKTKFGPFVEKILRSFQMNTEAYDQQDIDNDLSSYKLKQGIHDYLISYNLNDKRNKLIKMEQIIGSADLLIKLDAPFDDNLTLQIPRKLLDAKYQNETDYQFRVSTDNKPDTQYQEIHSSPQNRILKIELNDGDRRILVEGNRIDPGRPLFKVCNDLIIPYASIYQEIIKNDSKMDKKIEKSELDLYKNKFDGLKGFFPLGVNGKNYTLETYTTNNQNIVESVMFDNDPNVVVDRLFIYIDSTSAGKLQIKIPRELLDSTENGKDVPFKVWGNTFYILISEEIRTTPQSRTLSVPITDSVKLITIVGGNDDNKIITDNSIDRQNIEEIVPEKPKEIKKVSVNVVLGTHIYTLFDQDVSIKLYNSNGQFASEYLTVPDTGKVIQSFMVDETYIPEGTLFTICVTNEGNSKEDCKRVSREYGVDYIPVYMTVP